MDNRCDRRKAVCLKAGDQVCRLVGDELVFGTLEYKQQSGSSQQRGDGEGGGKDQLWKVKWIHDPSLNVNREVREQDLFATDRAVYKGSRVRIGEKVGICRSVLHKVDLRVLGTNAIIPQVAIEEFSHLKEFTQKSVVLYRGWLGVVVAARRKATIQTCDNTTSSHDLSSLLPTGPFSLEPHWINEQLDNFCKSLLPFRNEEQKQSSLSEEDSVKKKTRRLAFIRNLTVESVTVKWIHQIDPSTPDQPKQEFRDGSHTVLQLIKEDVSIGDSSFSFEVGNIGRILLNCNQVEFLRWDDWQRKFAKKYLPPDVEKCLRSGSEYDSTFLSKYWRVYDHQNKCLADGGNGDGVDDDDKENDKERSTKAKTGLHAGIVHLVVEIAHIYTIPDILWKDNTSEMPSSSLELEVLEQTVLSDAELPRPGDFITSKHLPYPVDKSYCVILRSESCIEGKQQLVVKVLDAEVPGKVIAEQAVIKGDDLRLSAKFVERHPIFRFFNEATTIAVVNEDGPDGIKIRIGNVVGTNLQGKANVRFLKFGSKYQEEWVWPQVCAIYSVKGCDLECIKSHVVDTDSTIQFELKLRNIIEAISKMDAVWKNSSKTEPDLNNSLAEVTFVFNTLKGMCQSAEQTWEETCYKDLTTYLALPSGILGGRPSYLKGNDTLNSLVLATISELFAQAHTLLGEKKVLSPSVEMIDLSNQPNPSTQIDPLEAIFSETVAILDEHPETHMFAKSTEYKPDHVQTFMKSVTEELNQLKKICSTENKSEIGILSRTYYDRMDLLSFLIRGPEGTPYENCVYIFDAHLPSTYPNVPPKFHFHAFKAGRLNPNLYAEGKVCVSLLGTWTGRDEREKWTKDSNIVQILISIQGLILVTEPYHNEPGLEAANMTAADAARRCREYNTQLVPLVIRMVIHQITFGMDPFTEQMNSFYKLQVPILLTRWRKWLGASNAEALGNEKPRFALFPVDKAFKVTMNTILCELEKIWKDKLESS